MEPATTAAPAPPVKLKVHDVRASYRALVALACGGVDAVEYVGLDSTLFACGPVNVRLVRASKGDGVGNGTYENSWQVEWGGWLINNTVAR